MLRRIDWILFALFCFNFAVLFYLFPSTSSDINRRQYDHIEPSFSNTYETNYFCFKVHQRIENEKMNEQLNLVSQQNIRLTLPIFLNSTRQQSNEIPYRYSTWQSSPNLPRRLTPCDHYVYTELLSILDQFFRRHQIEYLMVAGTLLGSYTHHDFLPWDDDVDLRISFYNRNRMYTFLQKELRNIITVMNVTDSLGNYDKIYFSWSPQAGIEKWSYPYIDVFYFYENLTHIWRTDYDEDLITNCSMAKHDVFPLVWRPFGRIWLPAPREPLVIFEMQQWTTMNKLYYAKNYSHKYERMMSFTSGQARPHELYSYYPWVQRNCFETYCIEQLISSFNHINNTIHSIRFDKYRNELVFDSKQGNRKCPL